jgi:hypothetical protein
VALWDITEMVAFALSNHLHGLHRPKSELKGGPSEKITQFFADPDLGRINIFEISSWSA